MKYIPKANDGHIKPHVVGGIFLFEEMMKREAPDFQIPRFYPLIFWCECCKCKDEFRREEGGRFTFGPTYRMSKPEYHVCQSCLNDFNVSTKDMRVFFFGERPKPPSPPPKAEG